ncbi:hypothetical protein [Acinetobacter chinensis]|uniref:hypothetical protein n=1 Tax=Acinetobacter chinensis TaxID=2004650 RepID=UPI0029352F2F|nr:hypothetical protein [Acinetobacter chinensis]WOE40659.1 hypothetical protein QSG87_12285 [Acinetobacter chinensis]
MNIHAGAKIGAQFTCEVFSADNTLREKSGVSKNLVLDSGLARMSVGGWATHLLVGSSSAAPNVSQTSMMQFVAATTNIVGANVVRELDPVKPYFKCTRVYRFAQGAAAGNLAEIGIGWASNACWNRALIRDANGDPTVLTILSDEFLQVTVEVLIYPMVESRTTINLVDKIGATISTHELHTRVAMPLRFAGWDAGRVELYVRGYSENGGFIFNTGMTEDMTTYPEINLIADGRHMTGGNTYPTPTSVQSVKSIGLDDANGTHRLLVMGVQHMLLFDSLYYKTEIIPPIVKTADATMKYTFNFTWSRLEE